MKLYRINKLARRGGMVVKHKDVLAATDQEAVQRAADSADCPVCEVLKDGQPIGAVLYPPRRPSRVAPAARALLSSTA